MTNIEILEKAIKKAIDGGWNGREVTDLLKLLELGALSSSRPGDYFGIIFNHEFAKALWGSKPQPFSTKDISFEDISFGVASCRKPKWEVVLMGMVIADDPIEYLGKSMI